ncbi:hypothetical protein Tsubulata_040085 [Turnera subulata]|uniref:Ribosomal protein L33 n=1 Tax=Turnera subulata TaxID=218843 RepID=A0A9Q0FCF9_9ROSI|nr:hypothetical protein Tsubulata_040085 [Turnera subulata]
MGDKKKKAFMFIRLVSEAGTGFFYVKRKSAKRAAEKGLLQFRKCNYVLHFACKLFWMLVGLFTASSVKLSIPGSR